MRSLGVFVAKQHVYKATTKPKRFVADRLLSQNFSSVGANQVWVGDIADLKTVNWSMGLSNAIRLGE